MAEIFKCDGCGNKKMKELWSLSKYGDIYYDLDTRDSEYCEKCFKKLEKKFNPPVSSDK